jgi:hypothetical protein
MPPQAAQKRLARGLEMSPYSASFSPKKKSGKKVKRKRKK